MRRPPPTSGSAHSFPSSEQREKGIEIEPCLLQNVGQGRALHWTVGGNRHFQDLLRQPLLQPQVASLLPHQYPSVPLYGTHNAVVRQARNLAHTSISCTRARSEALVLDRLEIESSIAS